MGKEKNAAPERCEACYWFRAFPWYVRLCGGFCSHPLVCRSCSRKLFLAEGDEPCENMLPLSKIMGRPSLVDEDD